MLTASKKITMGYNASVTGSYPYKRKNPVLELRDYCKQTSVLSVSNWVQVQLIHVPPTIRVLIVTRPVTGKG